MKVISVMQKKGGVGKTTVAVNLAFAMQELQPRLKVGIADADTEQHSADKWLARGQHSLQVKKVAEDGKGATLRAELESFDADVVILDLPPAVEALAMRAAIHANLVLIPIGASLLDVDAAKAAVALCQEVAGHDATKKALIVPTRIKQGTKASKQFLESIPSWGKVAKTALSHRIVYSDCVAAGQGVGQYAPGSDAHKEVLALAKEVLATLEIGGRHGKR